MSEEEKKAIKRLKENFVEYDDTTMFLKGDREAIRVVLSLIEKQQKEIEVLKIKINPKIIKNENAEFEVVEKGKYIPKSKIEEKLDLYSNKRSIFNYDNEINLLLELLESE